ncbi:MAG: RNB domain-containing ribonuclease [Anaerolineales bacterium]|nr:RNB domain-containing ribonuclease [Anaerolineales bacterium]
MKADELRPGALALYKKRPARLARLGERLYIELEGGNLAKVRPKDIILLHPGPMESLAELSPQQGEIVLAWEMLSENPAEAHDLAELAELIYGQYTPATAWATWELLEDGLYLRGAPEAVFARTPQEVKAEKAARQERAAEAQSWADFVARARQGRITPQADASYLREVEDLALGRRKDSRLLRELGRGERPENAHALLLACGFWDHTLAPYAARLGLSSHAPEIDLPPLPEEERLDLTSLEAFAIDDRDNQDPDDAISLEACHLDEKGRLVDGRLWVHVADAAALAPPGSQADLEARARGATIYLPDGAIPMLPPAAVKTLGLGLQEISPALSFGLELNGAGEIVAVHIQPSWVRVQRLSYESANERMEDAPLRELDILACAYQARRASLGALFIDLPETSVRVLDGRVQIRPIERLRSRDLVREAMLMAGEAAARYATAHAIPFPFATQEPPEAPLSLEIPPLSADQENLAYYVALRRVLKRSQVSSLPAPHAGVGLPAYSRATSPLRRYLDLVAHQQLRAHLRGAGLLNASEMLARVGASEAITGSVNQAESLSRRHWTLVYLLQNPEWQGQAVLVEKNERRGRVMIPELALEAPVHLREELPLNSRLTLKAQGVSLADLEAYFVQL